MRLINDLNKLITPEFFIKLTHFFIKTDKIERVTRIVCMTHGFGLAVSSCHCFTDLLSSSIHFVFCRVGKGEIRRPRSRRGRSSSIHFVFAGLERGKYEDPEVGEGDIRDRRGS